MATDKTDNHIARHEEFHAAGDAASGKSENWQAARHYSINDLNSALDSTQKNSSVDNFLKHTNLTLVDNQKLPEGMKNNQDIKQMERELKQKGSEEKLKGPDSKSADGDKFDTSDKKDNDFKDFIEKFRANESMDSKIPKTMSEQDQNTARDLNTAIAFGDSKGVSIALERFKNDPEGLRKFMDQYNQVLKDSGTGMVARTSGESVTFSDANGRGVEFSTRGSASVREVNHYPNGLVMDGDHIHQESAKDVFDHMGSRARFAMKMKSIDEEQGGKLILNAERVNAY